LESIRVFSIIDKNIFSKQPGVPKFKNYSGFRITHQARIFGQILPIFLANFGEIWLNQKIVGLMNYA